MAVQGVKELQSILWIVGRYLRLDIGFYIGILSWPLLNKVLIQDSCPSGQPIMLTIAHVFSSEKARRIKGS